MPKCLHCGNGIDGNQIVYRDANKGGRRSHSVRLCWRCSEKYDKVQSGKHARNIVLGVAGLLVLILFGGYLLFRY